MNEGASGHSLPKSQCNTRESSIFNVLSNDRWRVAVQVGVPGGHGLFYASRLERIGSPGRVKRVRTGSILRIIEAVINSGILFSLTARLRSEWFRPANRRSRERGRSHTFLSVIKVSAWHWVAVIYRSSLAQATRDHRSDPPRSMKSAMEEVPRRTESQ
jgi:hypothetical protein